MGVGLEFKVPGAIFKTILLLALFLTIASGSQAPCDDVNQTCEQSWNLMAEVDDESALAYDLNVDLAGEQSFFFTETVAFDYLNQSRSSSGVVQRVVTGNDTVQFINLKANDVDNDLLSYTIVSLPSHGNISGTGPNIIYVPEEGFVGNDSIVIGVDDGTGSLQNISLSIDVLLLYHPPSVRIRTPMNGEIFTADPLTRKALVPIRATSSGIVRGIRFYDGLKPLHFDIEEPCEESAADCAVTFMASLDIGTHFLTATATDSTEKSCTSLPVVITVNPPEPMVEITSPMAGEIFTAPADITITADVTDSHDLRNVEFFANSKLLSRIGNKSPCVFVWEGAKSGVYNLVAKATDKNGTAMSKPVLVVVVPAKPLSKSNLAITKTCSPNPVPAGGLLNYVITVTNRGPDSASDVMVEDFLPPEMSFVSQKASQGKYKNATGLWNVGGLTKYRSAKLVLTVRAPSIATAGQIYNTAYVFGAQYDPDNSNNHVTTFTRINARAAEAEELNSTEMDPSG